jgi:hypothetical protein
MSLLRFRLEEGLVGNASKEVWEGHAVPAHDAPLGRARKVKLIGPSGKGNKALKSRVREETRSSDLPARRNHSAPTGGYGVDPTTLICQMELHPLVQPHAL